MRFTIYGALALEEFEWTGLLFCQTQLMAFAY